MEPVNCGAPSGLSRAKKILFFPLSNVLGHLTRTFALAEEFDAQGHEVYVAADRTYLRLTKTLPPSIRVLPTPEIYPSMIQTFGSIQHYGESIAEDRANLEHCCRVEEPELRRRRKRIMLMVKRDKAIVEEVRPDAVITDYRFTIQLIERQTTQPVFQISHVLGYPSLYHRVTGNHFAPLHSGHILVPGVRNIEYWRRNPTRFSSRRREIFCGHFPWAGWRRLYPDAPPPPSADLFLFFGSTGNFRQIIPWLIRKIPTRYRISVVAPRMNGISARSGLHLAKRGELGRFLEQTEMAFCHGGHGTVMECICHQTPMVIFPHNIEQLEIGRRIEKMGLGVLVKRPYDRLSTEELVEIIEKIRTNAGMRNRLEKFSRLLSQQDGPKQAVETVLQNL